MGLLQMISTLFELILLLIKSSWVMVQTAFRFVFPRSKKSIKNDIVLITGAGHGLGKELAFRIAKLGAVVVLWDINQDVNDAVAKEIRNKGGKAYSYQCDITNEKQVESQARCVRQDVGDVTILINNAGIYHGQQLLCLNNAQIKKTLETNLLGHYWTTKEFLPRMMELSRGHIVAVSSFAGKFGQVNMTDYCSSKFGVVGFMESLQEELCLLNKDHCIQLSTVFPLTMNTGLCQNPTTRFPCLLPILKVDQAAEAMVNGILRNKNEIYIPCRIGFLVYISGLFPRKVISMFNHFFAYATAPNTNTAADITVLNL